MTEPRNRGTSLELTSLTSDETITTDEDVLSLKTLNLQLSEKQVSPNEVNKLELQVPLTSSQSYFRSKEDIPAVFRDESSNRYTLFPIRHKEIWQLYKKHQAAFWTAEEIDLEQDIRDWRKLKPQERHFLTRVLAFFAASDGIVLENLIERFCVDVQLAESRCFYAFQAAIENVHAETYSLLIDTYVTDSEEKQFLFRAIDNIPCVQRKAQWALKWISTDAPFVQRLVAFAAVEGIFFSGSFCAVFWMKKRGLMPGLTFSNELIARDEALHCEHACLLYSMLPQNDRLEEDVIRDIIVNAVDCEKEFVCDALSVDLIGMNDRLMSEYIEYVADRLLLSLGHGKLYETENPFDWMELISLQGKSNFFEKRVAEYRKANVDVEGISIGDGIEIAGQNQFRLDLDF